MTTQQIARTVGESPVVVQKLLNELEQSAVFSRNEQGAIFSRRMVKDERLRMIRATAGGEGGNPKLTHGYNKPGYLYAVRRASDGAIKIGIAINPINRLYKLRQQHKPDALEMLDCIQVEDMGMSEMKAHEKLASKRISSEWFTLNHFDLITLGFTLKQNPKDYKTPSSSSSSSPSVNLDSPSQAEEMLTTGTIGKPESLAGGF
jgi:hypothetical protein